MASTEGQRSWDYNTWDSYQVIDLISGPADMISVVSTGKNFRGDLFRAAVHKKLLCAYSEHYDAEFSGHDSEVKEAVITMDLPYDQVQDLICWLYTGDMQTEDTLDLLQLYVFAEKNDMLALRRFLMSQLIEEHSLEAENSMPFLEHLSQDCGLFRYLVDLWAGKWNQDALNEDDCQMADLDEDEIIPRAFFYQALRKLAVMAKEKDAHRAVLDAPCNYHEHEDYREWSGTCCSEFSTCRKPDEDYYKKA